MVRARRLGRVEQAVRDQLEVAGQVGSAPGVLALVLARDVDEAESPKDRAVSARELRMVLRFGIESAKPASAVTTGEDDEAGEEPTSVAVPSLDAMRRRADERRKSGA